MLTILHLSMSTLLLLIRQPNCLSHDTTYCAFHFLSEWKNDQMDGEGSLNVEHCRNEITVKANKWKNNVRRMKNLDVRFEEGSLCSSCSKVEPRRNRGKNKKMAVPGNVAMGEEGSVRHEMISLYSGRTNEVSTA